MPNRTIIRSPHNASNPFTQTANSTVYDFDLSDAARSLLWYILSLPDDWGICHRHLAKVTGKSEDTITRIMKELVDTGYATRYEHRTHGRWSTYKYKILEEKSQKRNEQQNYEPIRSTHRIFAEQLILTKSKEPSLPISFPSKEPVQEEQEKKVEEGFSFIENIEAAKQVAPPEKPKQEPLYDTPIVPCLEKIAMKEREKRRLCRQYSEDIIKRVVEYVNSPDVKIRTTIDRALFYYCSHPEHMITKKNTPIPPSEQDAIIAQNKAFWAHFKHVFVECGKAAKRSFTISLKDHANCALVIDQRDQPHEILFTDPTAVFTEQLEAVLRKSGHFFEMFKQFFMWFRNKIFQKPQHTQQLCQT
jgi:DNA-binding MarR family transcriptional regulator